jgi:ABC-type proline/glycine betaine transport system permease subunit
MCAIFWKCRAGKRGGCANGWRTTRVDDRLATAWARLPDYLSQHVILSACALLLGLAISVPLAIAAHRNSAVRWPVLTLASVIQTIPSLALLALFYPLLLALSAATSGFGLEFSALGFLPSLMALTLYSMLPIIRNTVAGLQGVDADVREAARGVGMTDRQMLTQVELPLAAPVIMAGVRTAAVWTIGTATLSLQLLLGDKFLQSKIGLCFRPCQRGLSLLLHALQFQFCLSLGPLQLQLLLLVRLVEFQLLVLLGELFRLLLNLLDLLLQLGRNLRSLLVHHLQDLFLVRQGRCHDDGLRREREP